MKLALLILMTTSLSFAASTDKKAKAEKPQAKSELLKDIVKGKEEEDCDDKAKKPIEIKAESISLTGNAGCSLDDM